MKRQSNRLKFYESAGVLLLMGGLGCLFVACNDAGEKQASQMTNDVGRYLPDAGKPGGGQKEVVEKGDTQVTENDIEIRSLEIAIRNSPMTVATTQDLTALAIFSDGSRRLITPSVAWSTDDAEVADFSQNAQTVGRLSAKKIGNVKITASYKSVITTSNLQIVEARFEKIDLPSEVKNILVGIPQKFTGLVVYDNGLSRPLEDNAVWTSSEPSLLTPVTGQPNGTFVALVAKDYSLRIVAGEISASVVISAKIPNFKTIELGESPLQMALGQSTQLRAFGVLADGTRIEITQAVDWSSSRSSTFTVSTTVGQSGVIRAVGNGRSVIAATVLSNGKMLSASREFSVVTANYQSIKIIGLEKPIPLFYKKNLSAIGILPDKTEVDITNDVEWSVQDSSVAAVSNINPGQLSGLVKGETNVTASFGEKSATARATVTDISLVELSIVKPTKEIKCGDREVRSVFRVEGKLSDGTDSPDLNGHTALSWYSNDDSVATVSSTQDDKGLLTSTKPGVLRVTAKYFVSNTGETLEASVDVTITPPVVVGYVIVPPLNYVISGNRLQLQAKNKYSCSEGGDPTPITNASNITWSLRAGSQSTSPYVRYAAKGLLATPVGAERPSAALTTDLQVKVMADIRVSATKTVKAECVDGLSDGCMILIKPREIKSATLSYPILDTTSPRPTVDVGQSISPNLRVVYTDDATNAAPTLLSQPAVPGHSFEFAVDSQTSDAGGSAVSLDAETGIVTGVGVGSADIRLEIVPPSKAIDASVQNISAGTRTSPLGRLQINTPCSNPAGYRFKNYCYYRGDVGRSCAAVCGGLNPSRAYDRFATETRLGNATECQAFMGILGISENWYDTDLQIPPRPLTGVGCRIDVINTGSGFAESPFFDPTRPVTESAAVGYASRICGCK